MSDHVLVKHINDVRSRRRIWRLLTDENKRRVLAIAGGDTFMLDTILEDVLDDQRHGE